MQTSRLFWKFFAIGMALSLLQLLLVAVLQFSDNLWLLLAGVPLLVLLAAGVLHLLVVPPLERMTAVSRRLTQSGGVQTVVSKRYDELGRLADAFNRMQWAAAERLLRCQASNQQLATVLDGMAEGVLAIAPDETILFANNSSRRLLDFRVEPLPGRRLFEVTRCRPVCDAMLETLRTKTPQVREFELPGSDRRVLSLRTTRLPGDPCPGSMVVLHEITELRRLERLRHEFVANVSHELKTPLAAIKAYAETLRLGAIHDPEHGLLFVERIEEQAERLHELIVDMLQIARVESGKQAFDMRDIEIGEVIRARVAEFDEQASSRDVRLELQPCKRDVYVHADIEGLRQIVGNLTDNALKYTPAGGHVTVAWTANGQWARIEVTDTGIGISPEDQARIFERFYRAEKARTREMGGTGLGLSIVKHLAQAFGGRVEVSSRPNAGSRFQVELPVRH